MLLDALVYRPDGRLYTQEFKNMGPDGGGYWKIQCPDGGYVKIYVREVAKPKAAGIQRPAGAVPLGMVPDVDPNPEGYYYEIGQAAVYVAKKGERPDEPPPATPDNLPIR